METRKVQVTGGSTFTVSIPKEWATANDVTGGSLVGFHREADTLCLVPTDRDEVSECTVDARSADVSELHRIVTTMYVSGFDRIVVETGERTALRREIGVVAGRLVGVEIVDQSSSQVTLGNLLDSDDVSTRDTVDRMRTLAMTMLDDAVGAVLDDDEALARGVAARDDDVDRFWFVVSRLFRASLRTPPTGDTTALDRETHYDYYRAARQFERVADHAQKIAHHATEISGLSPSLESTLEELRTLVSHVLTQSTEALFLDDADEATARATAALNEADDASDLELAANAELEGLSPSTAQSLRLVLDSLTRCAEYGGNVAETAIQHAAPRP
jgi:phosphate uptake regulator